MHRTSLHRIIAALLLLVACLTQRATAGFSREDEAGSLIFTIEKNPGKKDWISAKLGINGSFTVYSSTQITNGSLPVQESRRIFEELEKLIAAEGLHIFRPPPVAPRRAGLGMQNGRTFIDYWSLQGRIFELKGADVPPQFISFVRTLWFKLQDYQSKGT